MRKGYITRAAQERVLAEKPGGVAIELNWDYVSPSLRCEQNFTWAREDGLREICTGDELLEAAKAMSKIAQSAIRNCTNLTFS